MTPKEIAEELVNRFAKLPEEGTLMWYLSFEISKKCALIAVDELIKLYEFENPHRGFKISYWDDVKTEIEKL